MRKYTPYKKGKYMNLRTYISAGDSGGEYVYEAIHMTAKHHNVTASEVVKWATYKYITDKYGADNLMVKRWVEGQKDG